MSESLNKTAVCRIIHDLSDYKFERKFNDCVVVNGLEKYERIGNETIIVVNSFCSRISRARNAVVGRVDIDVSNHQVLTDHKKCGCHTNLGDNVTKLYVAFSSAEIKLFKSCSATISNMHLLAPSAYEHSYELIDTFTKRRGMYDWGRAAPTTGFVALIDAMHRCARVKAIGFRGAGSVQNHFMWRHHDIYAERLAVRWLHDRGDVMR